MRPRLFPRGAPGDDLGYAHTLKHWMNPREMWEDVADAVPEHARPRAQWEAWRARGVDPVAQATAPGPTLTALWSEVDPAWQQGYAATIVARTAPLAEPPTDWTRRDGGRWIADAGDGVLVEVRRTGGDWALYTAYRAADFKLTDYRCPPTDPENVSLRRALAASAAYRRVQAWRGRGSSE